MSVGESNPAEVHVWFQWFGFSANQLKRADLHKGFADSAEVIPIDSTQSIYIFQLKWLDVQMGNSIYWDLQWETWNYTVWITIRFGVPQVLQMTPPKRPDFGWFRSKSPEITFFHPQIKCNPKHPISGCPLLSQPTNLWTLGIIGRSWSLLNQVARDPMGCLETQSWSFDICRTYINCRKISYHGIRPLCQLLFAGSRYFEMLPIFISQPSPKKHPQINCNWPQINCNSLLIHFHLLSDVIRFTSIVLAIDVNVYCLNALFWTRPFAYVLTEGRTLFRSLQAA